MPAVSRILFFLPVAFPVLDQVAGRAVQMGEVAEHQSDQDAADDHDPHGKGKTGGPEVEDGDVLRVEPGEIKKGDQKEDNQQQKCHHSHRLLLGIGPEMAVRKYRKSIRRIFRLRSCSPHNNGRKVALPGGGVDLLLAAQADAVFSPG